MSEEQALRLNQGKPKLSYVLSAPNAINGIAEVMEGGAKKYARNDWKKGLPYTEVADSLLRHLTLFLNGEDNDSESGSLHVDHVLVNALFLSEFCRSHKEFDDRISIEKRKIEMLDENDSVPPTKPICTYPDCNCPFDKPITGDWCARGYKPNEKTKRDIL